MASAGEPPKPSFSKQGMQFQDGTIPVLGQDPSLATTQLDSKSNKTSPIHHHVEEYDGSQVGGYAPAPKPHPQSQFETQVDADTSLEIGPNTSMSVNTGTPFGHEDMVPLSESDFVMATPQKSLLSPPAVTRKTNGNSAKQQKVVLFHEIPQSENPSVVFNNAEEEPSVSFKVDRGEFERETMEREIGKDDDDADKEETSSMISEYGSEIGDVRLRLEDVKVMDALTEDSGSECAEKEMNKGELFDEQIQQDKERSQNYRTQELKPRDNGQLDFGESERQTTAHNVVRHHDTYGDDIEDDGEFSQDMSVDSVDLTSQHGGLKIEDATQVIDEPEETRATPGQSAIPHPSSPTAKRNDFQPSTPIGAVSAALRRFGNGMSSMKRFTKTPPGDVPNYHKHDDGFIYKHREDVSGAWLSPRFGNQVNAVEKSSIHQPQIASTPAMKRRSGVTPLTGITSCLSFDPESGRRPYGFMRMTDSPPSSPLPKHRKSKSWGSGGSEFFVESMKDLYSSEKIQVLDPHSMNTSQISGFHGQFSAGSQNIRPREALLSPKKRGLASPMGSTRFIGEQHTLTPTRSKVKKNQMFLLQSPQRTGDIEREDALDLLSLFVERSVDFHENITALAPDKSENEEESASTGTKMTVDHLKKCVDALRVVSERDDVEGKNDLHPSHKDRMYVLDLLVNTHTYGMEMKQAALSASTWLNAIGRTGKTEVTRESFNFSSSVKCISEDQMMQMKSGELRTLIKAAHTQLVEKNELNERLNNELSDCRAEIGRLKSVSRNEQSFFSQNKSILDADVGDDSSASSSARSFSEFPSDTDSHVGIDMANENICDTAASMADARKEIILLKAELQETNKVLRSMEQGIKWPKSKNNGAHDTELASESNFDNNEETTDRELTENETDMADETKEDIEELLEPISVGNSSQEQFEYDENTSILMDTLKTELEDYVEALRKADNENIKSLQKKIEQFESLRSNEINPEQKMINVRMLNAENFTTEWDELSPLPPTPDHDLRSPIVEELLSQWTSEKETQESLLSWIEKILNGQDCTDIPPLQLSGLDHQIKEGFTMHILPFLLRRSDIHVEVNHRAHRKTSYDMSVKINRPQSLKQGSIVIGSQTPTLASTTDLKQRNTHMMAFKASSTGAALDISADTPEKVEKGGIRKYISSALETGSVTSTTITAPISNYNMSSRLPVNGTNRVSNSSPWEENDHSTHMGSVYNLDQTPQQQGIVAGALNAMGGLLSRRRTPGNESNKKTVKSSSVTPQSSNVADITADMQEESQPYHRVVSAPPGRIGMTFVQYRGHAMISDVYKSSPLAGWVFPSDILIAIDEVPVSGMRVPEIVKLLTARKDQQRALRVISSHAMSELLIPEDQSL